MAQATSVIVLQRPEQPLEIVCARLRHFGCALALCDSYERAAAALAAEGADIVLIDAWVPDGLPLLTQMKASPATRFLPLVIATADEPAPVAAHALALGADDVFVLPIEDAELHARIRALARIAPWKSNAAGATRCSLSSAWSPPRKRRACRRSIAWASS